MAPWTTICLRTPRPVKILYDACKENMSTFSGVLKQLVVELRSFWYLAIGLGGLGFRMWGLGFKV